MFLVDYQQGRRQKIVICKVAINTLMQPFFVDTWQPVPPTDEVGNRIGQLIFNIVLISGLDASCGELIMETRFQELLGGVWLMAILNTYPHTFSCFST